MKLVFLGPPGAGKGTQAKLVAANRGIVHISTGDMLRQAVAAGTAIGKQVKEIMESGQLVSDDLIVAVIAERINESDCKGGYILDGFPRTVAQAQALEAMLAARKESLDAVVYFSIPNEELLSRLENRRVQENRADDNVEAQRERLKVYEQQTAPLVEFYRSKQMLREIDAQGSVEQIQSALVTLLFA